MKLPQRVVGAVDDNSGTPRSLGPQKGVMGSLIKKRRKKIRKHKLKKRRRANRHKKRVR